jgi:hypothetical protein
MADMVATAIMPAIVWILIRQPSLGQAPKGKGHMKGTSLLSPGLSVGIFPMTPTLPALDDRQ